MRRITRKESFGMTFDQLWKKFDDLQTELDKAEAELVRTNGLLTEWKAVASEANDKANRLIHELDKKSVPSGNWMTAGSLKEALAIGANNCGVGIFDPEDELDMRAMIKAIQQLTIHQGFQPDWSKNKKATEWRAYWIEDGVLTTPASLSFPRPPTTLDQGATGVTESTTKSFILVPKEPIHNAGQVGGDDDGEPIHQVGWLDPKDPTRIQVTTHYMIRELGNPENWVPLYAPNDGTTQPQPVHGVPSDLRSQLNECLTGVCEDGTFKGIGESLDELEALFGKLLNRHEGRS